MESAKMCEKQLSHAISLATIMLNTREQFGYALRDAATVRIRARTSNQIPLPRRLLELHVDDALYVIGRDGLDALENNIKYAVDEIIREALELMSKEGHAS